MRTFILSSWLSPGRSLGVRRKYWADDSLQLVRTSSSNTRLSFLASMPWLISSTHLKGLVVPVLDPYFDAVVLEVVLVLAAVQPHLPREAHAGEVCGELCVNPLHESAQSLQPLPLHLLHLLVPLQDV